MDAARQLALDTLIEIQRSGAFADRLLKKKLPDLCDAKDRSFVSLLVYGVVEKRILLDYYIQKISSVKFTKIHIVTLNILRLGLYQILFTNVPARAACFTSVELARKNGQVKATGFVNALLRHMIDESKRPSLPKMDNTPQSLSLHYCVHSSIVKLLMEQYGVDQAKQFLDRCIKSYYYTVVVNTLRTNINELQQAFHQAGAQTVPIDDQMLKVCFDGAIEELQAFRDGWFHVVGVPSFIAAKTVGAKPYETVLDLCAAPGGKTFSLAYEMKGQGEIYAFDVSPKKVKELEKSAQRLQLSNVVCNVADATVLQKEWLGKADRVLCDVPCSGLGIMAKKPDIRWRDMEAFDLYDTQLAILINGASYLKENGRLIYSTCTVNQAENEKIIERFLQQRPEFKLDTSVVIDGSKGQKLFWPNEDGQDGFYIACLCKKG